MHWGRQIIKRTGASYENKVELVRRNYKSIDALHTTKKEELVHNSYKCTKVFFCYIKIWGVFYYINVLMHFTIVMCQCMFVNTAPMRFDHNNQKKTLLQPSLTQFLLVIWNSH
jgi:hypothetical protein